jgi:hypothetical protein
MRWLLLRLLSRLYDSRGYEVCEDPDEVGYWLSPRGA